MRVNPNLSPTTPAAGAIIVPYFMDVETQVPRGKGAACWGSKLKDAGAPRGSQGSLHMLQPSPPCSHTSGLWLPSPSPSAKPFSLTAPTPLGEYCSGMNGSGIAGCGWDK